jgi:hypothetical protein
MYRLSMASLLLVGAAVNGFQTPSSSCQRGRDAICRSWCSNDASTPRSSSSSSTTALQMGIFDDLRLIFSDEGRQNRAEYEAREKAEMAAAQQEILERRRNPEKMAAYNRQVAENRRKLMDEKQVWDFQKKVGDKDYDPLTDWQQLRKEGKIQVGSDLKRDESSRRLGSEGLIDVRIDERMPYIDQGYVDDNEEKGGDPLAGLKNLFGQK